MPAASDASSDAPSPLSFRAAATIIAAGLFVTGLGWPGMIARLPLDLFFKNQLHFAPQDVAAFWAIGAFAWYVKPLVGLLCDAVPLLGTRRRGYLIAGSVAACLLWSALAIVPPRPPAFLAVILALNLAIVVVSTAIGGWLVEIGQRHGATGRLSALREGLSGAMSLVVGPVAGWLAARAIGWTAGAGALIWLAFIPVALWAAREPPATTSDGAARVLGGALAQLRVLRRAPTMWSAAGLLFLAHLAPGFQTPLLYRQQDDLHFTPHDMGRLILVGAIGAIAGSAAYSWLCRRLALRALLIGGILLNAGSIVPYLAYSSLASATAITLVAAVLGSIGILPIYDLAVRATPSGSESFGYALLLSVQTLTTLAVSDPLGATLYGHFHVTFPSLVWLNAATTAAVLLFVPFLPRALLSPRDRAPAP
jgi:MFS family permease